MLEGIDCDRVYSGLWHRIRSKNAGSKGNPTPFGYRHLALVLAAAASMTIDAHAQPHVFSFTVDAANPVAVNPDLLGTNVQW